MQPLRCLAFVLYSCAFPAIRPGPVRCLSHAISVSKLDAGQGGSGLGTCWFLPAEPPLCWVAAQDSETILFPAWMYSRLRIPWSPRPRWRLGARKKNGCGAHPKLAT
ncbi:hypothetical protein BJV77DRAFT_788949 [Russula vinacea]|nr:hypothetical protein BJV77DRAFT_788949 [Russula vinacea]